MPQYKIASYNTKNFFFQDSKHPFALPKIEREVNAMAQVINKLNADVIALQEIDDETTLAEFNDRLATPYEYYAVVNGNYYRGLHLGALSRFPFTYLSHKDQLLFDEKGKRLFEYANPSAARGKHKTRLRFQRDALLLEVDFPVLGTVGIVNLHLKSKNTSDWHSLENEQTRAAECIAVKKIIQQYNDDYPDIPVLVTGDLNTVTDAAEIQVLTADMFDAIEKDWVMQEKKPPYSYHERPHRQRIDYILMSDTAKELYVAGSATIHRNTHSKRASDHFPVSIQISS